MAGDIRDGMVRQGFAGGHIRTGHRRVKQDAVDRAMSVACWTAWIMIGLGIGRVIVEMVIPV